MATDGAANPLGGRLQRLRVRHVADTASKRPWTVFEVRDSGYDRRGSLTLIFISDGIMRRVRSYPENWPELSDAELMLISLRS
jgi:hypothetical protein